MAHIVKEFFWRSDERETKRDIEAWLRSINAKEWQTVQRFSDDAILVRATIPDEIASYKAP